MKDHTQSDALIEARILNKAGAREIETIEISQPDATSGSEKIELCFVIDTSSSMGGDIAAIKNVIAQVVNLLQSDFESVKLALVKYTTIANTTSVTGTDFVSVGDFTTAINTLATSGGTENAFNAINFACNNLNWTVNDSVTRAIMLVTDEDNDNGGADEATVLASLAEKEIVFLLGLDNSQPSWFQSFLDATGGTHIDTESESEIRDQLVEVLKNLIVYEGEDPIYLANDNQPLTAFDENGILRVFEQRAFGIEVAVDGTNGTKSINLTVDNADKAVSNYLAAAIKHNLAVEVTYRLYLAGDTSGPQNNPPLVIYLSDVEISGSVVSGALGWINLVDAPFPNAYYTRDRFPTL